MVLTRGGRVSRDRTAVVARGGPQYEGECHMSVDQRSTSWKPGDPTPHVRREIPQFEIPDYAGERYEAWVPDTLDIQERIASGSV